MNTCLITTVSMTLAMRVKSTLSANGIPAAVIRLPPAYTDGGCAYGVEIDRSAAEHARHILQISDLSYGKLICPNNPTDRRSDRKAAGQSERRYTRK